MDRSGQLSQQCKVNILTILILFNLAACAFRVIILDTDARCLDEKDDNNRLKVI